MNYNILFLVGLFLLPVAVRAFQEKYRAEILDPWVTAGILTVSNPSGWVYQLTRYKINNIICPGSEPKPDLI